MATNAVPRLHLNNGENRAEQWAEWLSTFKIYLIASEVNKKAKKLKSHNYCTSQVRKYRKFTAHLHSPEKKKTN
jgi:hypothetical protein